MKKLVAEGVMFESDLICETRDRARLSLNVFRPTESSRLPALVSVTPYGKDKMPDRLGMLFMRLAGVRFGKLNCSSWTSFEAPDPIFWCRAGYAVVLADIRGMHKSDGHAGVLTEVDAEDYFDLIEWVSRQRWSNGSVGLLGVSYLAMSQWRVAALSPPSLKAICPWEGVTDLLREFGYQDGIPETGFIGLWWKYRMKRGRNRLWAMAENFPTDRDAHPFDDVYWASKRPRLENITVPALVCASWSDQGLHTRGSLEGFERIGSTQKWLFTHGRRKWETFYSNEAMKIQQAFFDHFVKGNDTKFDAPCVRLEVRRNLSDYDVRVSTKWPLEEIVYTPLYLDAHRASLEISPPLTAATTKYFPNRTDATGRASFSHRFARSTEVTGGMSLTIWVSISSGDDFDVFVVARKLNAAGMEVFFYGYNGYRRDGVAKGWLRASHRELDAEKTRIGRPWHTHRRREPIAPGAITRVDIEILPSSTLFEAGSTLQLDVLGRDAAKYPAFKHGQTVNCGVHTIHTGGDHPSILSLPIYERADSKRVACCPAIYETHTRSF